MTMVKSVLNLARLLVILAVIPTDPCSGLRIERERGRRMEESSRISGKSKSRNKGKSGKTESTLPGKDGEFFQTPTGILFEVDRSCDDKYSTVKEKGKASGKASKARSCSPSSQPSLSLAPSYSVAPSEGPTKSAQPSFSPSTDPSESPSKSMEPSSSPSGQPSTNPSIDPSSFPSSSPSSTPSRKPSGSPSYSPSAFPSKEPSVSPSEEPSGSPSSGPTQEPSFFPSQFPSSLPSRSPSSHPSILPSDFPSRKPSTSPSYSPTSSPSESPTGMPSATPSRKPSLNPSSAPSVSPSIEPSVRPTRSSSPSKSLSPTGQICEKVVNDVDGEIVTTRVEPEPTTTSGGIFGDNQRLVFQYLAFSKATAVADEDTMISNLERSIHQALADHFVCQGIGSEFDSAFYIWTIASNFPDFVASTVCEKDLLESYNVIQPMGTDCMIVQADVKVDAYFPPNRLRRDLEEGGSRELTPLHSTTSADPQVVISVGSFLSSVMKDGAFNTLDVIQTSFLAFVVDGDEHFTIVDRGGTNIAGVNEQVQHAQENSKVVAGAMTTAAAAMCLLIVGIIALRKRKQRTDTYLRHLDDMSTFSGLDYDDKDFDRSTYIVGENDDNSVDWFLEGDNGQDRPQEGGDPVIPLEYQQNVHKCTSAYCETCNRHRNNGPTFIKTGSFNVLDILENLQAASSVMEERSYSSPDTVNL